MTAPALPGVEERVVGSLDKGTDLLVRVRELSVDGESFVDVREFVPSSDTYGRGVMVPRAQLKNLLSLLRAV